VASTQNRVDCSWLISCWGWEHYLSWTDDFRLSSSWP